MYEARSQTPDQLFAAHLNGSPRPFIAVVSSMPLTDVAREALVKSAIALGYAADHCSFITTHTTQTLDAPSLFMLLEALDPACLIIADAQAAQLLSKAYRYEVRLMKKERVFGRTTLVFENFESLMQSKELKQKAWKLLKQLPSHSV